MKESGKQLVHVRLKVIPEKEPTERSPSKEVRETENVAPLHRFFNC